MAEELVAVAGDRAHTVDPDAPAGGDMGEVRAAGLVAEEAGHAQAAADAVKRFDGRGDQSVLDTGEHGAGDARGPTGVAVERREMLT